MLNRGLHIVFTTLLLIGVVYGLDNLPFNADVIDPLAQALNDFEMTDLVFSQFSTDRPSRIDSNIVIVNIGGRQTTRGDIARVLKIINAQKPAVVGVDILFDRQISSGIDSLVSAVEQGSRTVLAASSVRNDSMIKALPIASVNDRIEYGHVNWPDEEQGYKTIRRYEPMREIEGQSIPSFAVSVANFYSSSHTRRLFERQTEYESIPFQRSRTWFTVSVQDLLNNPARAGLVTGRIVLVGFLGDVLGDTTSIEDRFWTPLNHAFAGRSHPDMYGVEIHANVISAILHGDYINTVPDLAMFGVFVFVLLANVSFFAFVQDRLEAFYDVICKTVQIVESIALLVLALYLFETERLVVPVSDAILGVILASDVYSVYLSFALSLPVAVSNGWKRFVNRKHGGQQK